MATNCTVSYMDPITGVVRSIFCVFDGYPKGVGATLQEWYFHPLDIEELLDLGDVEWIKDRVSECKKFSGGDEEAIEYPSLEVFYEHAQHRQHNYIFIDDEWWWFTIGGTECPTKLIDVLEEKFT